MRTILYIAFLFFISCGSQKKPAQEIKLMKPSNDGTTSCQLIEKEFMNKGGKITEYKELYLRCSVQDYFIKLCESEVTMDDLKPYIGSGITVEMEIKDGFWDHCSDDPAYAQSRTGTYVIIHSLKN